MGKLERVSEDPTLRESMGKILSFFSVLQNLIAKNLFFLECLEADVHTSAPTIGNAAVTWAGWAVSAVSAKFYRSQSDTRPRPPLTGKNLSKPASLGMSMVPYSAFFSKFWFQSLIKSDF